MENFVQDDNVEVRELIEDGEAKHLRLRQEITANNPLLNSYVLSVIQDHSINEFTQSWLKSLVSYFNDQRISITTFIDCFNRYDFSAENSYPSMFCYVYEEGRAPSIYNPEVHHRFNVAVKSIATKNAAPLHIIRDTEIMYDSEIMKTAGEAIEELKSAPKISVMDESHVDSILDSAPEDARPVIDDFENSDFIGGNPDTSPAMSDTAFAEQFRKARESNRVVNTSSVVVDVADALQEDGSVIGPAGNVISKEDEILAQQVMQNYIGGEHESDSESVSTPDDEAFKVEPEDDIDDWADISEHHVEPCTEDTLDGVDVVTHFTAILTDDESVPSDLSKSARDKFDKRISDLRESMETVFKDLPYDIMPSIEPFDMDYARNAVGESLFNSLCIVNTPVLLKSASEVALLVTSASHAAQATGHLNKGELFKNAQDVSDYFIHLIVAQKHTTEFQDGIKGQINRITSISDVRLEEADHAIRSYHALSESHDRITSELDIANLAIDTVGKNQVVSTGLGVFVLKNPSKASYISYKTKDGDYAPANPKLSKVRVTKHFEKALTFSSSEGAVKFLSMMLTTTEDIRCKRPKNFTPHQINVSEVSRVVVQNSDTVLEAKELALENSETKLRKSNLPVEVMLTPYTEPFVFPSALENMMHFAFFDETVLPEGATVETIYTGEYEQVQSQVLTNIDVQKEFFHDKGLHINVGTMLNENFFVETWKLSDWKIHTGQKVLKGTPSDSVSPISTNYLSAFGDMVMGKDVSKDYKKAYENYLASDHDADSDTFEYMVMQVVFGEGTPYKGREVTIEPVKNKKPAKKKVSVNDSVKKKKDKVTIKKTVKKSAVKVSGKKKTTKTPVLTSAQKRKKARAKRKSS